MDGGEEISLNCNMQFETLFIVWYTVFRKLQLWQCLCAIILVGLLLCLVRQAPYNGGTGVMVHDKLILWIDVYVVANC